MNELMLFCQEHKIDISVHPACGMYFYTVKRNQEFYFDGFDPVEILGLLKGVLKDA